MMQRTVAPGSRQAPDPHDQYLEKMGYYRKHTGRDPSNLFRVISEQLYDTQKFHLRLREECVYFMAQNREVYSQFVSGDFDHYLLDLSKTRTYGGILELRALAARYKRNMFLFESYGIENCSNGKYLDYNPEYTKDFQIFYTPDHHFDTVYHHDYMENLAFCQALIYEVLYRGVFMLPDINYAVERMLHDPDGVTTCIVEAPTQEMCGEYQDFNEIRQFYFDRPEKTNCVLNNRELCNFHNPQFQEFVAKLKKQEKDKKTQDMPSKGRTLASLLPMKDISCVCQLLKDQITPFPYKVAKSLDPYIYRNIDFDVWSETRRELRLQRWDRNNFIRVGGRCSVKLSKSQDQLYNCYIQDIPENGPCEVFVEELGEKRRVPIFQLQPLNGTQWRSWMMPLKYSRHQNEKHEIKKETKSSFTNLMHYTTLGGFKPYPVEVLAMPALTGNNSGGGKDPDKPPKKSDHEKDEVSNSVPVKLEDIKPYEEEYEFCHEMPLANTPPMYYGFDPMSGMYMVPQYGVPMQPCYGNFMMYPPMGPAPGPVPIYQTSSPPHFPTASPTSFPPGQMCNGKRCDGPMYVAEVDFNAMPSTAPHGCDLPLNDLTTIQFFYNTGIEYFTWLRNNYGLHQAVMGVCESQGAQGISYPQLMPEIENDHERFSIQAPNVKIECESQLNSELQHHTMMLQHGQQQMSTPQHNQGKQNSGQMGHTSGGRSNQQRHRKEHTPKSATKKHNQYNGKHHQGENHVKNGGGNHAGGGRDLVDGKNHGEAAPAHGYSDPRFGGKNDQTAEMMFNIPPPPMFGYQPFDGEPGSPNMNPYAGAPYFSPTQGMAMPLFPVMPPGNYASSTPTPMAQPPIAPPCVGPDVSVMPPPVFQQQPPRGMGGGNGTEIGNFVHHNGQVGAGGGTGGGMNNSGGGMGAPGGGNPCGPPRGNDNTSPYCVIPPPNPYQYQPQPLINVSPNRPPGNWYPITSRPPPPTVVVSHSGGNMANVGMYPPPNNDIPH